MGFVVLDGRGSGRTASVSSDNRLQVQAIEVNAQLATAVQGNAFSVTSDFVNITTTGSYSAILYLKNSDTRELYLFDWEGHSGADALWRLEKNPTTGTILDDESPAIVSNHNLGSTRGLLADAFKATGDSKTALGGSVHDVHAGPSTRERETLILDPGDSIVVLCKPDTAAECAATFHVSNADLEGLFG